VTGEVFHRTTSFCCACQAAHAADLRAEEGAVYFDVHCPVAPTRTRVSSSSAIFRGLRAKSSAHLPPLPSAQGVSWANFIEITKECNLECAICFSASHPGAGGELSVEAVLALGQGVRDAGLRAVTLSGGEPTLHPGLLDIIRGLRALCLDVTLATNGLSLAQRPELARELRAAGVSYVYVQMDTLAGGTCQRIRGGDFVERKKQAIANLRAAGVRFGLTTTVIRANLPEVGAILRFAAAQAPHLGVIGYLSAAPAGRFQFPESDTVNREDILQALIDSGAVPGLSVAHAWPFPRFAPLGLDVHPDCAALIFLAATPQGLRPLDEVVNIGRLYRWMARFRGKFRYAWGLFLLSLLLPLCVRPRGLFVLPRLLLGTALRRGRHGLLALSVEHFLGRHYQDEERLRRCTTCNVRPDGQRISTCVFEHPDPRRSTLTRGAP
jgi:pyruvate-formate lyase-activating enzyme